MNRYNVEHVTIAALGFLMGAVFAMIIAPGDTVVLIGVGAVFGFSARALFDQEFGGDWIWPFGRAATKPSLLLATASREKRHVLVSRTIPGRRPPSA
jgi:hypothetical protein